MACDHWQAAISALADGEDPGVEPRLLDGHLESCPACRSFQRFTFANLGAARLQPAPEMPDLSGRVVKLNAVADRASAWTIVRILLAVLGTVVIVHSLRGLVLGHHAEASAHAARHLGAFSIAYGVGLLVVAARPARARTMLPVATVLAGALLISAVVDTVNGDLPLLTEATHLPEMVSVVLIWLLAVPARPGRPDSARAPRLRAVPDDQTGASNRRSG